MFAKMFVSREAAFCSQLSPDEGAVKENTATSFKYWDLHLHGFLELDWRRSEEGTIGDAIVLRT